MSDAENLSKRERQKQRRQQKLQQERVAAARARRTRLIATVVTVALAVGAIGWAAYGWLDARSERQREIAEAQERLAELGCTDVQRPTNMGASHFAGNELAQSPPEIAYPDRPATSGPHIGSVAVTGVFDKVIDERLLVHNLEHGYVTAFYTDAADQAQVDQLTESAQEWIDGRYQKVIVSKWDGELPDGANFAFVAWDARQLCREYHDGVALAFLEEFHHLNGNAPERTVLAHTNPQQTGVIDPDGVEGDVLFPPLGETETEGDAMDEAGETPAEQPTDAEEPSD